MKIVAALLVAIASLCALGCESKPESAKPAATNAAGATAPAGSAQPASTGGW